MTSPLQKFLADAKAELRRSTAQRRYSRHRDRLEAKYRNRPRQQRSIGSAQPLVATAIPHGGCFDFGSVKLTIEFISAATMRIHWWTQDEPHFYRTVPEREDPPEVAVEFAPIVADTTAHSGWELSTTAMRIAVRNDGSLAVYDRDRQLIRCEDPPQQSIARGLPALPNGWQHQAHLQPQERIYGLGERACGLNLRGKNTYRMWNTDRQGEYLPGDDPLYISIPVYIGLHAAGSYLVFYENPCDARFSFDTAAIATFAGGPLRYYVSVGEVPTLLDAYTQLTGRPALPPRWAFGYHHSRWGYEREAELRATYELMQRYDISVKTLHLDIDCLDEFRPFTISPDRFPQIREFIAQLTAAGVKVVIIVHPCVPQDDRDPFYQAGVAGKYFCTDVTGEPILAPLWAGDSGYVDYTNPAARAWWSQQYQQLLAIGISGFWHDMNEPAILTDWGDPTLPPHATYHDFEGKGGNHLQAHNLYGLLQAQAGYERLRELEPHYRPFILSRAGWAGIQQYAWVWTGDTVTAWESLRQTIPTLLNLGLSGIPFCGSDIGGFNGTPTPELYLRWFQLSCFVPFCRTHGSKLHPPRVPWGYGDRVLQSVKDLLTVRCALIPYLYTLAWEANQTGAPLVRPLWWTVPEREDLLEVEDTFRLGAAILVAPIVHHGQTERVIPLPPGDWYDFWSNNSWQEQPTITVPVSFERIPILVKAGTIVPMETADILTLHCYVDRAGNCSGSIYTDALDGYGASRVDRIELIHTESQWQLNWTATGEYPYPYDTVQLLIYGIDLTAATADGLAIDCSDNLIAIHPFQSLILTGTLRELGQQLTPVATERTMPD